MLWGPTLGGAPARAPGGCVFEEQVGVGGVMREIGALVQGDGWYKEECTCMSAKKLSKNKTVKWV